MSAQKGLPSVPLVPLVPSGGRVSSNKRSASSVGPRREWARQHALPAVPSASSLGKRKDGSVQKKNKGMVRSHSLPSRALSKSSNDDASGLLSSLDTSGLLSGRDTSALLSSRGTSGLPSSRPGSAASRSSKTSDVVVYTDTDTPTTYTTQQFFKDGDGTMVPLKNRKKVLTLLRELNAEVVVPLCRSFSLRCKACDEFHFVEKKCQLRRPGVALRGTTSTKRWNMDGTTHLEKTSKVTIRLRVRLHPSEGDPQSEFLSKGTHIAVLLHELCHLRHMGHDMPFMFLLRDLYLEATERGVFIPGEMDNQVPSGAPWENEIFRTGGRADKDMLTSLWHQYEAIKIARKKTARKSTKAKGSAAG